MKKVLPFGILVGAVILAGFWFLYKNGEQLCRYPCGCGRKKNYD